MRLRTLVAAGASVGALTLAGLPATGLPSPAPTEGSRLYILVLRNPPLATFRGDDGFARTAPRQGHRFSERRAAVTEYGAHLARVQADVVASLGGPEVVYSYTTALDGFAARLTPTQARMAQANDRVAAVRVDRVARLDGAPDPASYRSASAITAASKPRRSGRGVVIGVVDSGIWPENPSFAAPPIDPARERRDYPGFSGACADGDEAWSASLCNRKILAAAWFAAGFGADRVSSAEYLSPRDGSGHGSHVAATAAGDPGVNVTIGGETFGRRSGAAPGAALAVYKACWSAPDPADDGCSTADALAAVDRAVRDGVDVLNYSASIPSVGDPVELAFRNAAAAGVFVAVAAGDGGPSPGSVAHPSPWVTTVAATSPPHFEGGVLLGDGARLVGSMVSNRRVSSARLVYGADAATGGVAARDARLCMPGSLDAAKVEGAIVLCDRGVTARVSKSFEVAQAGGRAMILANTAPGPTDPDVHSVPTVHVDRADGASIRRYVRHADRPTASLDPTARNKGAVAHVAAFSGRGPARAGSVLKPDVAAPGAGIVGAVAPPSNFGRTWDVYSGTSMAAPQVAGLAARIASERPAWTPAAIKSAITTTARPIAARTAPFAAGSGQIDASRATDPGLVYGLGTAREGSVRAFVRDPASFSIGSLVGRAVLVRHVTSVGSTPETYTASVTGLPGLAVRVTPAALTLRPGESARFRVTVTARSAARYGDYVTGELRWTGSAGHVVRSPIVARAEVVAPPAELQGFGSAGSLTLRAEAGVTGTLRARVVGPVGATASRIRLQPGAFDPRDPVSSASTAVRTFMVPPKSVAARFETDLAVGGDVDLYVYRGDRRVAAATSSDARELVTLRRPESRRYTVYVTAPSLGSTTTVTARFAGWTLGPTQSIGSTQGGIALSNAPVRVTGAQPVSLELRWSGLAPSQRWFGAIRFKDSDELTYVTVN